MASPPIKWKSKIILAKVNPPNSEGQDSNPTGAANAMLLTDVQLQPMEGEDVSRNLETPFLGAQPTIPTGIHVVLTGSFELVGSGTTGVAPAWGPLMRMCGVAEVVTPDDQPGDGTVEYFPVSDDHEDGTIYFWLGPTLHKMLGVRGTCVKTLNAQGIPIGRVTLTGLFVMPADQARPAVVLTAFQKPQIASKANTPVFTIAGATFIGRSFSLDLRNDVQPRLLLGTERIIIADRSETLSVTVEAVPMAVYNPYARANDQTPTAVVIEHGTQPGKRVRIEVGQAQQQRPGTPESNQNIVEWPLVFTPLPTDAGDDQWKITLT